MKHPVSVTYKLVVSSSSMLLACMLMMMMLVNDGNDSLILATFLASVVAAEGNFTEARMNHLCDFTQMKNCRPSLSMPATQRLLTVVVLVVVAMMKLIIGAQP